MDSILQGVTDEANDMAKFLEAIYAEYRRDFGSLREYVKFGSVLLYNHMQSESMMGPPQLNLVNTMNGRRWQLGIRRTWRAQNNWQMLCSHQEEDMLTVLKLRSNRSLKCPVEFCVPLFATNDCVLAHAVVPMQPLRRKM